MTFDIETTMIQPFRPLIAATAARRTPEVEFYDDMNEFVDALLLATDEDYTLAGFNSAGFDFQVLSSFLPNRKNDIRRLALDHFDPAAALFCHKGYMVGLDKIADGLGVKRKVSQVELSNGNVIDISGAQVEKLWVSGETNAVKAYLRGDVMAELEVIESIIKTGSISWIAKSGKLTTQRICDPGTAPSLETYLALPAPDTTWMKPEPGKEPWTRERFYGWL